MAGSASDPSQASFRVAMGDPSLVKVLVVGECGEGKSTLINHLKLSSEPEAESGMDPRGKTKAPECYRGRAGGKDVLFIDTPGVGDRDIHVGVLVGQLEVALGLGLVDGVLICSSIAKHRVTVGAKVVQAVIDKGIVGPGKWNSVILCGTQADRCDDEEIETFRTNTLAVFNSCAKGGAVSLVVVTSSKESPFFEELENAIASLPDQKLTYKRPPDAELAGAISQITGTPMQEITEKIKEVHHHFRHQSGCWHWLTGGKSFKSFEAVKLVMSAIWNWEKEDVVEECQESREAASLAAAQPSSTGLDVSRLQDMSAVQVPARLVQISDLFKTVRCKEDPRAMITVPSSTWPLGPLTIEMEEPSTPLPLGVVRQSNVFKLEPHKIEFHVPVRVTLPMLAANLCLDPCKSVHFFRLEEGAADWEKVVGGIFEPHQGHLDMQGLSWLVIATVDAAGCRLDCGIWFSPISKECRLLVVPVGCPQCLLGGEQLVQAWEAAGFERKEGRGVEFQLEEQCEFKIQTFPGTSQEQQLPFNWVTVWTTLPIPPEINAEAGGQTVDWILSLDSQHGRQAETMNFTLSLPSLPRAGPAAPARQPPAHRVLRAAGIPRLILNMGEGSPAIHAPAEIEEGSKVWILINSMDPAQPGLQLPNSLELIKPALLHFLRGMGCQGPSCLVMNWCCPPRFAEELVKDEENSAEFAIHWINPNSNRARTLPPEVAEYFNDLFLEELELTALRLGATSLQSYSLAYILARARLPDGPWTEDTLEWVDPWHSRLRCWPRERDSALPNTSETSATAAASGTPSALQNSQSAPGHAQDPATSSTATRSAGVKG